jgi:hypothetical protein
VLGRRVNGGTSNLRLGCSGEFSTGFEIGFGREPRVGCEAEYTLSRAEEYVPQAGAFDPGGCLRHFSPRTALEGHCVLIGHGWTVILWLSERESRRHFPGSARPALDHRALAALMTASLYSHLSLDR